mgnify:CR=1 FL=1
MAWSQMPYALVEGCLAVVISAVNKIIVDQLEVESGLLHNYCFPSEERAELINFLADLAPEGLDKVFLLTTGSESTECAIKLARSYGISKGGNGKIGIVGFERGFHGRTLGSQQAGDIDRFMQQE